MKKIHTVLKDIKNSMSNRRSIKREYNYDCKEYLRWQYNNPVIKTQNSLEAKILRQAHMIEKGMSLPRPREKFGESKALELLDFIDKFVISGYNIESSTPLLNAIGVINAYLKFHNSNGYNPEQVSERFVKYKKYLDCDAGVYGIVRTNKNIIMDKINSQFPDFFCSRHSVRQFDKTPITQEEIRKAVKLAIHAPSACNRQSCKVYFYEDEDINVKLGELIAGNTGFECEVKNYLVITSDISSFYDSFERNQMYIDGGIFTMALVESLHYYGIASCILQNGEYKEKNIKIKTVCKNIPENEKIVLFIAIGHYRNEFAYATSHRKMLSEVLKIQ